MKLQKKDVINKNMLEEIKEGKIRDYSEGFFIVEKEDEYFYYINVETKKEFGPFVDASTFQEGLAPVMYIDENNERYCSYMDKEGNIMPFKQNRAYGNSKFSDGYAKVGTKSFIDKEGNIINYKPNNPLIKYVSPFKCERAIVTCEIFGKNFYYFIDKNFNRTSKKNYDVVVEFNSDRAVVGKNKNRYIIDKDENIIFQYNFEKTYIKTSARYTEDLIRYYQNFKWGFLDIDGNVAIESQFEDDIDFSDNVAIYHDNDDGNVYIIDKKGNRKQLLSKEKYKKYKNISNFKKGYALLSYNRLMPTKDLVDKEGNIIEFKDNIILYDDYLVLGDEKSFIKVEDLKRLEKDYQVIINRNDKEIIKTFESEEKRDEYYEMLEKEIKNAEMTARRNYNERLDRLFESPDTRYEELRPKKGRPRTKI